ncbi:MAG: LysE family translocator [Euryarchaeota archaeon]|jgi:threonine/homoserine/homoserine lactone efflux protein|nr:LysE family translocator [Euryarchaeota archaeon]MBT6640957.1 LysE family translocator [Euryarchaeota archaeon]MBT6844660.1 LysE family translocator [Euryarchaeota archaeon]MBT7064656.1 LysE family translocator [Euryarchaeota archaeon]MBT7263769.1 LysE family translocator [Euryarchaeota archaeon]
MEAIAWEVILAAGFFFVLGAVSPGPSLIIVLRNTLIGGRRQGVACALGHGVGFGIYAGSAVFGLILLLENAPSVFLVLQLIGVALLIWYGILMWTADINALQDIDIESNSKERQGFGEGFAIAFFNPKIALFLVAVLAQVLKPGMGIETKLAIGLLGMTIDMGWYVIVAVALTGTPALETLRAKGNLVYRITAVALWFFAGSVTLSLL